MLDDLIAKHETLESNPALLEKLTQKWDKIQSLFQKHQVSNIEDLILVRDNLANELEQTQDLDKRIGFLKDKINTLELSLEDLSNKLHQKRKEASPKLCEQMEEIISKMGMKNASL